MKKLTDKNLDSIVFYPIFRVLPFVLIFIVPAKAICLTYTPPDTIVPSRQTTFLVSTGTFYAGSSIYLYNNWYKNEERTSFHVYNDWGIWQNVDKVGHLYSTWFQSWLLYKGFRWTGMDEKTSIWAGAGTAMLFQTTFEIMDGFVASYGFSWSDMAFNTLGAGAFVFQQTQWGDQKIVFKLSSRYINYSDEPIYPMDQGGPTSSRLTRANNLYGNTFGERFLKDYNSQTYWASFNMKSLLGKENRWPGWLNLSIGYGATDMYGGFENQWIEEEKYSYSVPEKRYSSIYFAPDIDLRKLKGNSPFFNTILDLLNLLKFPAPTLEFGLDGTIRFHLLFF